MELRRHATGDGVVVVTADLHVCDDPRWRAEAIFHTRYGDVRVCGGGHQPSLDEALAQMREALESVMARENIHAPAAEEEVRPARPVPAYATEKAELYAYSVSYSEDDECYVGTVQEWPYLTAHADTEEEALAEIKGVVALCIWDCDEEGDVHPDPAQKQEG